MQYLLFILLLLFGNFAFSQCQGDVNEDYNIDVQDIVFILNHILDNDEIDYDIADMNEDSTIDILDIISLVNIVLSDSEEGVDEDEDGICDDVDDCVGEYDECGVCNGSGYYDNCDVCDADTSNDCVHDTLVSAFFGLDNALPGLLCNQPGTLLDGMPVNFKFPLDASSLSETDFEVLDSLGNIYTPSCVSLAPANENGENRTVLLLGEFGTAVTNPPVEVRVVGDLFTTDTISGESACSEIINLNGINTTNIIPLDDGPSLFFAQKIDGNLNECISGIQTIQVAWNGGITPYISGDSESDLFQYYIGYSDSSGVLIPHVPISIADINDNDNFHQLCFSTSDEIVKISMMANTVEDPNHDPNTYSEIDVVSCTP